MDTNECDTIDFRLPPRKRLLAGLKKQSFSERTPQCSQVNNHNPKELCPNPLSEFDLRLSNLLKSYANGSTMSPLEIVEAARSKAAKAAKKAKIARASAEEKAAIAAKAVAAAKSALDFVSSIEKCGEDEELARRLHRSMNSSPRISKRCLGSKYKNYKHKNMGFERSNEGHDMANVDDKVSRFSRLDDESGEANSSHLKRKDIGRVDEIGVNGRKRGRTKQKKLRISVCSSEDQANPKEGIKLKCRDFNVTQYIKPDKVVES